MSDKWDFEDAAMHISPERDYETVIEVWWLDSYGGEGWSRWDDLPNKLHGVVCKTVGYLLNKTPNFITIIGTTSEENYLGRITIPMRSVIKLTVLREGEEGGGGEMSGY